jgi:hypothetical protein
MSSLFNEKNTKYQYLSQEIVPIINVQGIWFEEKEVLDFTDNDEENYKQFLEDIAPRPIAENSSTICLSGVINGMPPLVRNINSKNLKIENFAPIKGIPYDKENQLEIRGYRSGTRSSIIKAKSYTEEEFKNLENKDKLWVIAKHNDKIYVPDDEKGDIFLRLKGCSMWTQKNQNEYTFPNVLLRDCKCYRNDIDYSKKYIEVRGFNSVNASARELYGIREVKPYFDKLDILVGNYPLGFWKYINLKNDPSPKIEKCVCVMETIGDKRVETHFICGSEKMLYNLIKEEDCENLIKRINKIFINKKMRPPSAQNATFTRALELPLYDMGLAILEKRYTFVRAMENFDSIMEDKGFLDSKLIMDIIKDYDELYTMALIYAEIGYEAGRILSTFHRTGNNWGTFFNDDIRLIDSNAHGDNLIILEKKKVKERYEKEKIFQLISMVDFDQLVRPEISISVWEGEIKRNPKVATEYFWVELESLGNDLGGVASERQFFMNIPKRERPYGIYYNLLYILRDCLMYELMMSYIDPLRKRHFEKDLDIDKIYEIIEKGMALTVNKEA